MLARSETGLQETQQQFACTRARTLVVPLDLGNAGSITKAKTPIERDLGIASVLVNAAGVFGPIDLVQDNDPAAWIETLMINTAAPHLICRAFVGE